MEERTFIARPFALVIGASTGIGYELASHCAEHGFDLLIAADEPSIEDAARTLRARGAGVDAVEADLSTEAGIEELYRAARGRRINALLDTDATGTVALIQKVGRDMREQGQGRILITGPFIDSFALALRAELEGSGVTVTCLMPGASEKDQARTGFEAMMRGAADAAREAS
jgi:short-subunit dehydrogenase